MKPKIKKLACESILVVKVNDEEKSYRLSRYGLPLQQAFEDWAKSKLPDPFANLMKVIDKISPELQQKLFEKAEEEARRITALDMRSEEVKKLIGSTEGMIKQMSLLLNKHHPEMSDADVWDLLERCVHQHGEEYLIEKISATVGELEQEESSTGTFRPAKN